MKTYTVAIMNHDGEVIHVIGEGMSETKMDKVERGALRNLDVDNYYVWTGTDGEAKKLKRADS